VSAGELSRRDLARRGLLAGGAALAVTVPGGLRATRAFGQEGEDTSDTDSEILIGFAGFQQQAVVGYKAAIDSGTLGDFVPTATVLSAQGQEHYRLLTAALAEIDAKPKPPQRTNDVPGLTEALTREDYLEFLVKAENQVLASGLEGQKLLGKAALLTLTAQICGNVGQHLVVLRQALGKDPIPAALPSGFEKR
jgi:hypothetical protein